MPKQASLQQESHFSQVKQKVAALCAASSLAVRQYHFIYEPKTWADAQSYCREKYTDLVTVDSLDVVTILNKMVDLNQMGTARDAWIGLFEDVDSWRWSLVNDTFYQGFGTQYRNWRLGEPNNLGSNEPCTNMNDLGEWNDYSCEVEIRPMCFIVSGQKAEFVPVNILMTWTKAQTYCRTHYTDLASVRSSAENKDVFAKKPSGAHWLGLYRDTWKWSDGDGDAFSYWSGTQPAGSTEHCATTYFSDSGRWRDWLCSYAKPFICHHDVVSFKKHVMKIKLVRSSTVDLYDAGIQSDILNEFWPDGSGKGSLWVLLVAPKARRQQQRESVGPVRPVHVSAAWPLPKSRHFDGRAGSANAGLYGPPPPPAYGSRPYPRAPHCGWSPRCERRTAFFGGPPHGRRARRRDGGGGVAGGDPLCTCPARPPIFKGAGPAAASFGTPPRIPGHWGCTGLYGNGGSRFARPPWKFWFWP
ncbi:uncharacterized protein LOC118557811 [Fundulus heteroclitus]|uniref:uncharacterized protein LOC118557811 n=1 Tax=Fundulus heteroclitus TaxID=8078 RepID=UPI00165ACB66|nr:uncharacterized protein LOC118557811 [Fundulus heteroclitus]